MGALGPWGWAHHSNMLVPLLQCFDSCHMLHIPFTCDQRSIPRPRLCRGRGRGRGCGRGRGLGRGCGRGRGRGRGRVRGRLYFTC
eukprot:905935-Pyramimonas_sp.AAC.1